MRWLLGIRSAVHGKIRACDVRRFRTGDKRDQRGDFINVPVAAECSGGLGNTGVGLNRDRLSAVAFNFLNNRRGRL